jgi:hypothetical protein
MASLIIDDIVEVSKITTIFSLLAVLGYLPPSVIVGQVSISTGWGCFLASVNRFPTEGSPRFLSDDSSTAMICPTASDPWWAKAMSGESRGTMRWIDSMMV